MTVLQRSLGSITVHRAPSIPLATKLQCTVVQCGMTCECMASVASRLTSEELSATGTRLPSALLVPCLFLFFFFFVVLNARSTQEAERLRARGVAGAAELSH
jgi:hypothetical protein